MRTAVTNLEELIKGFGLYWTVFAFLVLTLDILHLAVILNGLLSQELKPFRVFLEAPFACQAEQFGEGQKLYTLFSISDVVGQRISR